MHVLIVYGSKEGQTAKIAEYIAQIFQAQGLRVSAYPCEGIPSGFTPDGFDAAVVGGSIHISNYPAQLRGFVMRHCDWLNRVPSAFFTVCMAIHSQNAKERDEARNFGIRFTEAAGWHPTLIDTFAGAVKYTQYNFFTRFIMKRISKREGGSTDTSHDHEYTDWDAVARFANHFVKTLSASG